MSVSVGDLADWILEHRKGDAFPGYDWHDLVDDIERCIDENSLVVAAEGDKIYGVCCGELDTERRVYHAANIITITPRAMIVMIQRFHELFPKYEVRVKRKGKDRILNNTEKTLNRLVRQQLRK